MVRHKSFSTPAATLDEAVFDLESMDYDFYLFTDEDTGQDALVWRELGGTYRVQFADGLESSDGLSSVASIETEQVAAPELTVDEAQDVLDTDTLDWVFFRDASTGRARLLYRRYDGNYGLLVPANDADADGAPPT